MQDCQWEGWGILQEHRACRRTSCVGMVPLLSAPRILTSLTCRCPEGQEPALQHLHGFTIQSEAIVSEQDSQRPFTRQDHNKNLPPHFIIVGRGMSYVKNTHPWKFLHTYFTRAFAMTIIYDFQREHCSKAMMFDLQISVSRTTEPPTVFFTSAFLGSSHFLLIPHGLLCQTTSTCHLHLAPNQASDSEFGPGPLRSLSSSRVRSSRMLVELCRLPLETPAPTSPLSSRPAQLTAYLTTPPGCLHGKSKSA